MDLTKPGRNNVKASELAAGIGISKSLLSDIIHYRRRLRINRLFKFLMKEPEKGQVRR